eukprot:1179530-Prorocentrum_minimum.AAC.4
MLYIVLYSIWTSSSRAKCSRQKSRLAAAGRDTALRRTSSRVLGDGGIDFWRDRLLAGSTFGGIDFWWDDFGEARRLVASEDRLVGTLSSTRARSAGALRLAAPAAAAPPPSTGDFAVDEAQPVTTLQLRLHDGTRLTARFNHTHTVGDVFEFIKRSRSDSPVRNPSREVAFGRSVNWFWHPSRRSSHVPRAGRKSKHR